MFRLDGHHLGPKNGLHRLRSRRQRITSARWPREPWPCQVHRRKRTACAGCQARETLKSATVRWMTKNGCRRWGILVFFRWKKWGWGLWLRLLGEHMTFQILGWLAWILLGWFVLFWGRGQGFFAGTFMVLDAIAGIWAGKLEIL